MNYLNLPESARYDIAMRAISNRGANFRRIREVAPEAATFQFEPQSPGFSTATLPGGISASIDYWNRGTMLPTVQRIDVSVQSPDGYFGLYYDASDKRFNFVGSTKWGSIHKRLMAIVVMLIHRFLPDADPKTMTVSEVPATYILRQMFPRPN
jgi:hypothetical protein